VGTSTRRGDGTGAWTEFSTDLTTCAIAYDRSAALEQSAGHDDALDLAESVGRSVRNHLSSSPEN